LLPVLLTPVIMPCPRIAIDFTTHAFFIAGNNDIKDNLSQVVVITVPTNNLFLVPLLLAIKLLEK
jgi:hypothetical protein